MFVCNGMPGSFQTLEEIFIQGSNLSWQVTNKMWKVQTQLLVCRK